MVEMTVQELANVAGQRRRWHVVMQRGEESLVFTVNTTNPPKRASGSWRSDGARAHRSPYSIAGLTAPVVSFPRRAATPPSFGLGDRGSNPRPAPDCRCYGGCRRQADATTTELPDGRPPACQDHAQGSLLMVRRLAGRQPRWAWSCAAMGWAGWRRRTPSRRWCATSAS